MLTVKEVAERLNLSSSKVYQLVSEGRLSHHRFDGAIRFAEEQIQDYLEETRQEPVPRQRKTDPRPRLKHLKL